MMSGIYTYMLTAPVRVKKAESIKAIRRKTHMIWMILSVISMLLGYTFIAIAHSSTVNFFGYIFSTDTWDSAIRVIHAWTGYVTILLMLGQAAVGMVKYQRLLEGTKSLTFHGLLGKVINALACVNVILGVWAVGWSDGYIVLIAVLMVLVYYLGLLYPYPFDKFFTKDESNDGKSSLYGSV